MAHRIFAQNGKPVYGIKNYVLDTTADLQKLPVSDTPGSTAFVVSEGKTYILNNSEQWVATNSSSTTVSTGEENIESITNQQIDTWFATDDDSIIPNQQIDDWFNE